MSKKAALADRIHYRHPAAAAMVRFSQVGSLTAAQRVPEKNVIAPRPGGQPQ